MDLDECFKKFEYEPHRGQIKLHKAARNYRNLLVLFGRRGGKSHASGFEAAISMLQEPHPYFGAPSCLVTAPTADLTKAVFERTHDLVFKYLKKYKPHYSRSERVLTLRKLGSKLYARSGDKPKSLVSRGYSDVIIDESGFFRDDAFRELEPAMLERQGRLIAIGVPALQNWYFERYKDIKRGTEEGYILQLPSIVNPAISIKEWHRLFRKLPHNEFLRQYCAKFIEDSSNVWKISDLERSKIGEAEDYDSTAQYVAGVDFARKQDSSVVVILKLSTPLKVVSVLKLNLMRWSDIVSAIVDFLHYWNVQVATCDATGLGDAVIEQVVNSTPVGVAPFIFTNESKTQVVDALTVELENARIEIPAEFTELHDEMKIYEYTTGKLGGRIFNAPEGYHDDHVTALVLALRAAQFDYIY